MTARPVANHARHVRREEILADILHNLAPSCPALGPRPQGTGTGMQPKKPLAPPADKVSNRGAALVSLLDFPMN